MKAMILAAGRGTRLRPFTFSKPKPLFPILNRPLIAILIDQLLQAGVGEIAVNTHHLSRQITDFILSNYKQQRMHVFEEESILGTGGGLKRAEAVLNDDPFLLINGDIFSNIDLAAAYRAHLESDNAATMVLHDYPEYNNVMLDKNAAVKGFSKKTDGQLAFTGIHILNPDIFSFIPKDNYYEILDAYLSMIGAGLKVGSHMVEGHYWTDIGTIQAYLELHNDILLNRISGLSQWLPHKSPFHLGKECRFGTGVQLSEWVCIGDAVEVGENASLARCVIWEKSKIDPGARIVDAIICPHR